jgi:hypothetical protein
MLVDDARQWREQLVDKLQDEHGEAAVRKKSFVSEASAEYSAAVQSESKSPQPLEDKHPSASPRAASPDVSVEDVPIQDIETAPLTAEEVGNIKNAV